MIILVLLLVVLSPVYLTATRDALKTVYVAAFDSENSNIVDVNRISLTGNKFIIDHLSSLIRSKIK